MSEMIKEFKKGDLLHIDKDGKAQWGFPEGYPYKQMSRVTLVDNEYIRIDSNTFDGSASWGFNLIEGETYDVISENVTFHPIATKNDKGNLALTCYDEGFEVLDIIQKGQNNYYLTSILSGNVTCTIIGPAETIHPMSVEFLPTATKTAAGTVKQAAAVANVTAAPTAEEFNALLKSLRDAGILATE